MFTSNDDTEDTINAFINIYKLLAALDELIQLHQLVPLATWATLDHCNLQLVLTIFDVNNDSLKKLLKL